MAAHDFLERLHWLSGAPDDQASRRCEDDQDRQAETGERRVTAALIDELGLEDRINEEVRVILEAFQDDMLKSGASYPEMFKKVKMELARKYKAVL